MPKDLSPVVNIEDVEEIDYLSGNSGGGFDKLLTPTMRERGGNLGVNRCRVPPGRAMCPFHSHQLEDEVFFVLSGSGVLRYGERIYQLRPGDCVSCPAGTGLAHQVANNGEVDLVYLAVGPHLAHEVCTYPDSGKVFIRSLNTVGHFAKAANMDGEPDPPRIFELAERQ